jgi:hypothetical protein
MTMSSNKIVVSLLMVGSDGFPRTPPIDWPLGQLPSGSYEVEVVKRSASGANEGLVGRVSFVVQPRSTSGALYNFTDLYYDVREPGWGMSVTQLASGGLFVMWYAYDDNNKAVWYFMSNGQWVSPLTFRGPLYRSTGSSLFGPYDPARFQAIAVGTLEIGFSTQDFDMGGFVATIDGVTFVRGVRRQRL